MSDLIEKLNIIKDEKNKIQETLTEMGFPGTNLSTFGESMQKINSDVVGEIESIKSNISVGNEEVEFTDYELTMSGWIRLNGIPSNGYSGGTCAYTSLIPILSSDVFRVRGEVRS